MDWKRVTIFISSTFNDMHAERDYLVKDVFPELREWCEERKIHLVDIDLRWGVTEADSSSNHTVLACLNNIDESRPFFLCFLGQRRGWIPKDVSPETLDEYPDISNAIGRNSVTEMEIEHALLSPLKHIVDGNEKQEIPVNHALFYFRSPDYLDDLTNEQRKIFTNEAEQDIDLADRELKDFKEKIKTRWDYTVDYDCGWDKSVISPELPENVRQGRLTDFSVAGKDLKDIIIEQLKEEIIKEFPDREEVEYASDLEKDLDQQALFIELNSEGFISREGDFDDLNEYVTNDKNGLFVLAASAGSGKSMLLTNFIIRESKKHNIRFINRFCGVSDLCSQTYSLWKTIFDEAGIECPDTFKDLKDKIEDLLKELAGEKTVLIIDAVNQLPDGLDMLEWLPKQLPENLKIILSLKEDEQVKDLTTFTYSTVKPFKDKEEKKKLINDYLKKYLKALDAQQIDTICGFEGSKNPLYLKILLSELRIFGSFAQLSDEIRLFGETPKEAFYTVLNRLEKDINSLDIDSKEFAPVLFGLLANARNGLSEKEIVSCMQKELDIDNEKLIQAIRLFIRQVRPFMARREGRTDYFYEAFKLAAQEKYANNKIHYNKLLADYFNKQADPENDLSFKGKNIRDFNELPYHLKESEKITSCHPELDSGSPCLEKILSTYLWIKNKSELSDIQNTINDYNYIDVENEDYYHVKLIRDTLIMSSHVLKENIKDNLPSQLWGRLKETDNPKIKEFLIEIDKFTDYPWLKPRHYMNSPEGALKVTLTGHTNGVRSVCISPDGKYIASGGDSRAIRVWDLEKQKEICKLKVSEITYVQCICFSPDGKYIAYVGPWEETIRVWDWKNAVEIQELYMDSAYCICFSSDGKFIASGGSGNTVRVWDWKNAVVLQKLERRTDFFVGEVCFSPDDKYIASVSSDKTIRVWDWIKQKEVKRIEGHTDFTGGVYFSSDGKYIASGSRDKVIHIWDWEKQKEVQRLEGHTDFISSVCFSPDDKYIASGSYDKTVRVWDWEKQKEVQRLEGHTHRVNSVCFSPDEKYLVSGSDDKTVKVWDWGEKKEAQRSEEHVSDVECVCFSPDSKYIASGSYDNTIKVLDWEKQKEEHRLEGHKLSVNSVCFSPDGRYVASGSTDSTIKIWDTKNTKEIQKLESSATIVRSICFSPNGKYIASGYDAENADSNNHSIKIWDWKKAKEVQRLEGYPWPIRCVCFSPDGKYIASVSHNTIRVLDWEKQREVQRFDDPTNRARCICFSSGGKYIASGYDSIYFRPVIRILDWANGEEIRRLEGHIDTVKSVCFSPDDKYLVSGSDDQTVRIWKWRKQNQMIELDTESPVFSCIFSNNNRQIAAGGSSGKILMYDIENLPVGIAIVTALRDVDNRLSVRCSYCAKLFDILEDELGNIVKCPHCNEELQLNGFSADPIIIEDENDAVENRGSIIIDEKTIDSN